MVHFGPSYSDPHFYFENTAITDHSESQCLQCLTDKTKEINVKKKKGLNKVSAVSRHAKIPSASLSSISTLKFVYSLPCLSDVDDFMLLLCASLQRQVFDEENKAAVRLMAGDNVEICRDLDAASFSVHNPVPDFIHCRYSMHCNTHNIQP